MSAASPPDQDVGQLLYGARAIADYLGISERRALYLAEKGSLPFWKDGRTICARRSTVAAWLDERERAAMRDRVAS